MDAQTPFLKPPLPRRIAELRPAPPPSSPLINQPRAPPTTSHQPSSSTSTSDPSQPPHQPAPDSHNVRKRKEPNTPEYWLDVMIADASKKSSDPNFKYTCLAAMQQREKNAIPRELLGNDAWDHVVHEARYLRRDMRWEREWKTGLCSGMVNECREAWARRIDERGFFVADESVVLVREEQEEEGVPERVEVLGYRRQAVSSHPWRAATSVEWDMESPEVRDGSLGVESWDVIEDLNRRDRADDSS